MSEINHESVLIQIRQGLNRNNIKLWEEPYCVAGESNEAEIIVRKNVNTMSRNFISLCQQFIESRKHLKPTSQHQVCILSCCNQRIAKYGVGQSEID